MFRIKAPPHLGGLVWLLTACSPLLFLACGVNGVTTGRVDPPPAVIAQNPAPTPGPTPLPWQLKVTFKGYAGNDPTAAPLNLDPTSRIITTGSFTSSQILENGFLLSGQTITETPWVSASLVFSTIETCPINIYATIYMSGTNAASTSIGVSSFSYAHPGYQSTAVTEGTPQVLETCGINFTVSADFAMGQ